jgi:hypothetical protein
LKPSILVALAVVVTGCAGSGDWTRSGTSPRQTATELSECQSEARAATERDTNIMTDIMATRGSDWRRSDVMSTQMSLFAAENHNRTSDIINRCMIGKGFAPSS